MFGAMRYEFQYHSNQEKTGKCKKRKSKGGRQPSVTALYVCLQLRLEELSSNEVLFPSWG